MSFRRLPNNREYWSRFCRKHHLLVERLHSISLAFSSPDRFEELLQLGVTRSKNATAELTALTEEEWRVLTEFVDHFSRDWQSYFVETLYPSYFQEIQRRATKDA